MNNSSRRATYLFLCSMPFLAAIMASIRPLRISGLYQVLGIVLFAAIVISAWILSGSSVRMGSEEQHRLAICGTLLIAPFALFALLWVGLGPPFAATPRENVMRYMVLLVSSVSVSIGFIVLNKALNEGGEHSLSVLGFATTLLAGSSYLIWMSFALGASIGRLRDGHLAPAVVSFSDIFDIILFVAGALTYLGTAAFAASLGRLHWIRRGAAGAYAIANLLALLCLIARGLSFPNIATLSTPWYTQPGVIVGIPAVPFIMPCLLGVMLIRRAGDSQADTFRAAGSLR